MKKTPSSFACLYVWGAVVLLATASETCTAQQEDALEAGLELYKSSVLVAEPLVVRAVLHNAGAEDITTAYSRAGALRSAAGIDIQIRKGDEILFRTGHVGEGGMLGMPILVGPRIGDVLPPGGSVRAERTICPYTKTANGSINWLPPGVYQISASLMIQGRRQMLQTKEQPFEVLPLPAAASGLLDVISVQDRSFLQGWWRNLTPEEAEKFERLRAKFPNLPNRQYAEVAKALKARFPDVPHRQYYEYRMLPRVEAGEGLAKYREDLAAYRSAAMAYIEEFPKSPYVDDALWDLARMEQGAGEYEKTAAHLETLLRDYPDSPLKQEVEELQKKMKEAEERQKKLKEAVERAAERKAAKEKKAASEAKPAPAEDQKPDQP